jgi:anti-sigma factor RsiW
LNCRDAINEISNFIDGDLGAALKRELEHHFAECEECRLVVVQTQKTIEIFVESESKPHDLPLDVQTRLHDRLRKKLRQPEV